MGMCGHGAFAGLNLGTADRECTLEEQYAWQTGTGHGTVLFGWVWRSGTLRRLRGSDMCGLPMHARKSVDE